MNGIPRLKASGFTALLLTLGTWGAAPEAMAECACMCIEGVAYEVCTGIVTTQTPTQQCADQLQCPATPTVPETTDPEPEPAPAPADPAEPSGDTAGEGLDCRQRQVYRPDLGEYKLHTVCMPAARSHAHDRLRAKRQELAERHASRRHDAHHDRHEQRRRGHRGNWDWRHGD